MLVDSCIELLSLKHQRVIIYLKLIIISVKHMAGSKIDATWHSFICTTPSNEIMKNM